MLTHDQLQTLVQARNIADRVADEIDENDLEHCIDTDEIAILCDACLFMFEALRSTGHLATIKTRGIG